MMSNLEFYSAMASYTATHLTDSWQNGRHFSPPPPGCISTPSTSSL